MVLLICYFSCILSIVIEQYYSIKNISGDEYYRILICLLILFKIPKIFLSKNNNLYLMVKS